MAGPLERPEPASVQVHVVAIVTEFGGGVVAVGAPEALCLPASKIRRDRTPNALPGAPPETIDAYSCYAAVARQEPHSVTLVDQFADAYPDHGFTAVAPIRYCTPTQLPGIPVRQPQLRIVCERLDPAETLDVPVITNDAFALGRAHGEVTETLCLPALAR